MNIYFYQRSTHRKRQQETVEHCPAGINVLKPDNVRFIKDTVLSIRNHNKKLKLKSKLAKLFPLNTRMIRDPKIKEADYIYTWSCIPALTSKPYLLEMDNPYSICYYNLFWFKLLKPLWKGLLLSKKLKYIVCISEACQKSISSEFGPRVLQKTKVVYPYMSEQPNSSPQKSNDIVEFLFVSTQFLLKGGRETLHAFQLAASKGHRFHVTMVTNLSEAEQRQYAAPYVSFVKADIDKTILHQTYFSKADVFILPSYQDSFGMVYLEALSFGLPIIATRIYAIPEMVRERDNGFLVDAPVHFYKDNYQLNPRYAKQPILQEIASAGLYKHTTRQLEQSIINLMDKHVRQQMSIRSLEIFKEKFSPSIRDYAFLSLLTIDDKEATE